MFAPDLPELEAKATIGTVIAALVLLVCILAAGAFFWIRHQRDQARLERDHALLEVKDLHLTITGYELLAAAQQKRLANATEEAARRGEHRAEVVQDLQKDLPRTDDEARAWALAAAKRLGQ